MLERIPTNTLRPFLVTCRLGANDNHPRGNSQIEIAKEKFQRR
jgi:hypothetical protein